MPTEAPCGEQAKQGAKEEQAQASRDAGGVAQEGAHQGEEEEPEMVVLSFAANNIASLTIGLEARELSILWLGVEPEHQRQGLGSALLASSLLIARFAGARRVLLDNMLSDAHLSTFYTRWGFVHEHPPGPEMFLEML